MDEVKPGNDNFIFGVVIGGLEPKYECIFHVDSIRGGQNQTCTAFFGIGGPIYGQSPDGEVGRKSGGFGRLCRGEFQMKSTNTCPLIVVLGLYLMSNSLSSMTNFTSLLEVSGLCSICFIGCSVIISMV